MPMLSAEGEASVSIFQIPEVQPRLLTVPVYADSMDEQAPKGMFDAFVQPMEVWGTWRAQEDL